MVTLQILAKSTKGAVAVTDTAGNPYTIARDVAVSGGRLLVLTGLASKPLTAGAKITAAFPGSTSYQMVADELTGVTRLDRAASATGTTTAFSSGSTVATTSTGEVVFAAVASFTAATNPTWSPSWTRLTPQSLAPANHRRAYQHATTTRTFTADGTTSGTWAALVLTFQP